MKRDMKVSLKPALMLELVFREKMARDDKAYKYKRALSSFVLETFIFRLLLQASETSSSCVCATASDTG